MAHRIKIGQSGSGKDNAAITDALKKAIDGEQYVTLALAHEPDWQRFLGELYFHCGEDILDRLVIDRVKDEDKVIMREVVGKSKLTGWGRRTENEEFTDLAIEMVAGRRNRIDLVESPALEEHSILIAQAKQDMDAWLSDSQIHYAMKPHTDVWHFILDHLPMSNLRHTVEDFQFRSRMERMTTTEATFRLWNAAVGTAEIEKRTCKPGTPWKRAHLNKGGITVLCGSGCTSSFRMLVQSDFVETYHLARQGLDRGGIYYINELLNLNLGNAFYGRALSTARYMKLDIWAAVQHLNFPDPAMASIALDNCDQYWGRITDPELADRGAAALRGAFDPMKVHHEDEIIRSIPVTDYVERKSKGKWSGPDGKGGSSENTNIVPVTTHHDEIQKRPVYESGKDQQFWQAAKLQEQKAGEFWVCSKESSPRQKIYDLLPDSWAFDGLRDEKVEELIAMVKEHRADIYETPVMLPTPVFVMPQAKPKPAKNAPKKPAKKPRRKNP